MKRAAKVGVVVFCVMLALLMLYLAWNNRASEKIAVSALAALVATVAFLLSLVWDNRVLEKAVTSVLPASLVVVLGVVAFGESPPVTSRFPVLFVVGQKDLLPSNLGLLVHRRGHGVFWQFVPRDLAATHPEVFAGTWAERGPALYHQFLHWVILDVLQTYFAHSWQTDVSSYDSPAVGATFWEPSQGAPGGHTISKQELRTALGTNVFASVPHPPTTGEGLVVPPATTLTVKLPSGMPPTGEMMLMNPYCELRIETRARFFAIGAGVYGTLAGLGPDRSQAEYGSLHFEITITARFARLKNGHPEMLSYRRWVEQVTQLLRQALDEQLAWRRVWEGAQLEDLLSRVPSARRR